MLIVNLSQDNFLNINATSKISTIVMNCTIQNKLINSYSRQKKTVRRGPLACFLSVGSGEQEQRAEKRGWEGHKGMTVQLMVVLEVGGGEPVELE